MVENGRLVHMLRVYPASTFESLLTTDPLVHGAYSTVVIWLLSPSHRFELWPVGTIATGMYEVLSIIKYNLLMRMNIERYLDSSQLLLLF